MNQNSNLKENEQLREVLLDLERSVLKEREIRIESEALLSGLRLLTDYQDKTDIFINLLEVLRSVLGFESALVMIRQNGKLRTVASTSEQFRDFSTLSPALLKRITEEKKPIVFFDLSATEEIALWPEQARKDAVSVMYILLRADPLAILIFTHSKRGFFSTKHIRLANRFAPLASQALHSRDYTVQLENINSELKIQIFERICAEEIAAQRQAQATNNAKMAALGEMAGGIAHEINTPLAVISMKSQQLTDIIKDEILDKELIEKTAESIFKTSIQIAKIITSLRSFSSGDETDVFSEFFLKEIIADTIILCNERFKQNSIRIEIEDIPSDLHLQCRRSQISQVILNILNNSYDAIRSLPDKWIKITTLDKSQFIEIRITDSGSGISAPIKEKMFQPFFTTKDIGKGTGLGLSISKGLIESHKGTLSIDEESKNTCFVISLPKVQD